MVGSFILIIICYINIKCVAVGLSISLSLFSLAYNATEYALFALLIRLFYADAFRNTILK